MEKVKRLSKQEVLENCRTIYEKNPQLSENGISLEDFIKESIEDWEKTERMSDEELLNYRRQFVEEMSAYAEVSTKTPPRIK